MGAMTVSMRVLDPDLDADALELALDVHAHFLERPLGHIGRMRVKAGDHAPDGALDQLLGIRVLHIIALDELERLREGLQVLIGIGLGLGHFLADQYAGREQDEGPCEQQHDEHRHELLFVDPDHVTFLHENFHILLSVVPADETSLLFDEDRMLYNHIQ